MKNKEEHRIEPVLRNEIGGKMQHLHSLHALPYLAWTDRLRDAFMVEYIYNSNAIEGNTLTLQETELVLEGLTIDQKPKKDHSEVIGQRDAFLYMEDIAQDRMKPITESDIKNIHSLVLMDRPEERGKFRRVPVRIEGAYTEPVHPFLIEPKITSLLIEDKQRKVSLSVPTLERVARFHLEFEGIHPFVDGNGRTGRLLMNLQLIREGYPPINVKFTDRRRYYDAFDAYYRDGDASVMVDLIAEYVNDRLDDYMAAYKR